MSVGEFAVITAMEALCARSESTIVPPDATTVGEMTTEEDHLFVDVDVFAQTMKMLADPDWNDEWLMNFIERQMHLYACAPRIRQRWYDRDIIHEPWVECTSRGIVMRLSLLSSMCPLRNCGTDHCGCLASCHFYSPRVQKFLKTALARLCLPRKGDARAQTCVFATQTSLPAAERVRHLSDKIHFSNFAVQRRVFRRTGHGEGTGIHRAPASA